VVDVVVLVFNAVPSENGDVPAVDVEAPKERFNGAFAVALLPSEKPK
jgi:hypothetical protein